MTHNLRSHVQPSIAVSYSLLRLVAFKPIWNKTLSCVEWRTKQAEWRGIGVQQSRGWVHYAIHRPEPHIMLFRRPLNYGQPQQAAAVQQQPAGMKA
jgi:hypothetical protein